MKSKAFTDTPRDEWSVLAALDRVDLQKPSLVDIADDAGLAAAADALQSADIVVDGLFGTGLARPVTGHYRFSGAD